MGERLEIFIDFLAVKKKDFAEAIGLQQSNLAPFIGQGAKLPKDEIVQKIANMGLDVHWWVTGEGEMFASNVAGEALKERKQAAERVEAAEVAVAHALKQVAVATNGKFPELNASANARITDLENTERVYQEIVARQAASTIGAKDTAAAHKWALVREWLTETGTMAEWYFILQQAIPGVPLDYVLSLEGLAPKEKDSEFEFLICDFVRERGIDPDWIATPNLLDQFAEGEAGCALKAQLMARYAPKSGTAPESSDPLRYSEPELAHQDQ